MSSSSIRISQVFRGTSPLEADERLDFTDGLNVIVGAPNTGKTKWLKFIDFCFGDPDNAEKSLGEDVASKYDHAGVIFTINGAEHSIERTWHKYGLRSKIVLDGRPLDAGEFSDAMLSAMDIPKVRYSRGNPMQRHNWVDLSWRTLFRHLYRSQGQWHDLIPAQPPEETRAAFLQFLGLAQYAFAPYKAQSVEVEAALQNLNARWSELSRIISSMLGSEKPHYELRDVEEHKISLNAEIAMLDTRRSELLEKQLSEASTSVQELSQEWSDYQAELDRENSNLRRLQSRLDELNELAELLWTEIDKLDRAKVAGEIFSPLRITHCPACDQLIRSTGNDPSNCFLCHQSVAGSNIEEESKKRVQVEQTRLRGEHKETQKLIHQIAEEVELVKNRISKVRKRLSELDAFLRISKSSESATQSPEIRQIDFKSGRLHERLEQLDRVFEVFKEQEVISGRIAAAEDELHRLSELQSKLADKLDYPAVGDRLCAEMNSYLNDLETDRRLWTQGDIRCVINQRSIRLLLGSQDVKTKLGATFYIYVLLSYHFALLSIGRDGGSHFPNLAILDLPPKTEDTKMIREQENFLMRPFLKLLSQNQQRSQVIVAGASFMNLEADNRIELKHVWKG